MQNLQVSIADPRLESLCPSNKTKGYVALNVMRGDQLVDVVFQQVESAMVTASGAVVELPMRHRKVIGLSPFTALRSPPAASTPRNKSASTG
jgi:hypothetical protein